jgi:hypothetical protein
MTDSGGAMIRQESSPLGSDQGAGSDAGAAQGGSRPDGQAQGQGNMVDAAKEKIQQLASQARQSAGQQVESRFSDGKQRATQTLGSVAQSLHSSSQQLRDQQQNAIGKYADQAANKIEEISRYLENASLNDVATRVEDFARREPALFIGGAVALGFLGARFLKSSQRGQQGEMRMRQGFEGGAQQGYQQQGYEQQSYSQQNYSQQGYSQQRDSMQGSQGAGGSWQNPGERDVTPAPGREWTTGGNERQSSPIDTSTDRPDRA